MKKVIPELFIKYTEKYKDNIAFNYFEGEWKNISYKELLLAVKSIASHLINIGIKKGDRIAIIAENRPEWCMTYLAISLSGGIAVPIDIQLGPDQIKNLISDSESRVVFHSQKTEDNVRNACSDLIIGQVSGITSINFDSPEFHSICRTPEQSHYQDISEGDTASIIYTSGTTGMPKGVELSHRNFCSDAEALIKARILSSDDSVISILPLHHTYPFMGNCLIPLLLGISISYPPSLKGPDLMATMKDKGITILVGVPQLLELIRNGIFNKIRQLPGPLPKIMLSVLKFCGYLRQNFHINLGRLIFKSAHKALGRRFRFFACGGAKLDSQVMKDLESIGFTVLEGYGLTETSPVVTFNPIEKRKPGSVGRSLPSAEIKILDSESRKELGEMREGEIVIKGPMVMKGYYKNPQATANVLKEGWFFSGDLGYMDNEGYLFITGRSKEVIVLSSGKNIYPEEIEKSYLKVPLIKELCVMGIEERGSIESLEAVIVPDFEYAKKVQIGNLLESLKWEINNVSLHLPDYMRIKGYTVLQEPLPRTPLGKLRRFMVKDLVKVKSEELKVTRREDERLTEDETGRKVIECIEPLLKEKINIQSTDNLELDLGFDSLARIELVVSLEKAFSMKLPETFASEIQTIEELIAKIKEHGTGGIREIEKGRLWVEILKTDPDLDDRRKIGLHHGFLEWMLILFCLALIRFITRLFFRLKADGLENLPKKGPYIITPNHASYLDAFVVVSALSARLFRNLYSIGIQKYFAGRIKESFARLAHVIPIDPETFLSKAMQMASYVLRNRKSLLIFPEGGRSYDSELMEFKKGVGILSLELNVPVIPVYIRGSFEALPKSAWVPRLKQIHVLFGKPFYPTDIDPSDKPEGMDNYQFFVNELRDRVRILRDLIEIH